MDAVEDIKQRLSVEDVVSQYVQLKRAGRNWKGLSPFGNEHTPSFMVSPEKQIWHDFSSGRGGDMFTFVMEMEGVDFRGALEILARQAGLDLDQYRSQKGTGRGKEKERLYKLLDAAVRFYQVQFSQHKAAFEYVLSKRQFNKKTALSWQIGYSPEDGRALCDYARQKGFSERELQAAGLATKRYRGLGDMFRGRIMIPLMDAQGRVIGFTARLLKEDPNVPKYINTSQTLLYDKSRHVFGLHAAKEAIRKQKYAVIAEGNLDVLASHQVGVSQVVATAGTALTEHQLKTLSRFTPDIRLCFDADRAGISATERAIPIASKAGVSLSVITLPSGKDPDELIRSNRAIWEDTIRQPQYALDWLIDRYRQDLDLTTATGKRQFSDIILSVVRTLTDPVEREHYLGRVSEITAVRREVLESKLRQDSAHKPRLKPKKMPRIRYGRGALDAARLQNNLLALVLFRSELRTTLTALHPPMFSDPVARKLFEMVVAHPDFGSQHESWSDSSEYAKILLFIYEELYQQLELSELRFEAVRLQAALVDHYVKIQKQRISHELQQAAGEQRTTQLLEAARRLDTLLKAAKELNNNG